MYKTILEKYASILLRQAGWMSGNGYTLYSLPVITHAPNLRPLAL